MLKANDIDRFGPELSAKELESAVGGGGDHRTDVGFRRSVMGFQSKADQAANGGFDADHSAAPILP
jgi:hypothetical protein